MFWFILFLLKVTETGFLPLRRLKDNLAQPLSATGKAEDQRY